MNIISKEELKNLILAEYEYLIRTESHDYAILWASIKFHVSKDEVTAVIDKVSVAA